MDAECRVLSRIALIAFVIGLQAAACVEAQAQKAADPAGLQRVDFTLADVRYQILVPQDAPVLMPSGQIRHIEIRYPRLTRTVRLFRLSADLAERQETFAHASTLSNGAVLKYSIDRNIGGGSGGTEGELKGRLELGVRVLAVLCHDQDEWGYPRPEWCVPYLHHLRIDDSK
jgi:hypothetical protein